MNPGFWSGKRVFLTGHTGFKGSWAATWLKMMKADVFGYALAPNTSPTLFDLAGVGTGLESVIADVRDSERVRDEMVRFRPDIVLHMAAQPLVRYSYDAPHETYSTNVMGVVNVFEAVRAVDSVRVVVNVTSDKCYENREWVWGYRENEAMGGHDPYSSSKGCAELVTSAYRLSFFQHLQRHGQPVGIASGRAGNVVGGGDWAPDRLIPDVIRAFLENRPVEIRNPDAVRPWQHVLEPVSGYLSLAEKLWYEPQRFSGGWNFGPPIDSALPVRDIVELIKRIWDAPQTWIDKSDQLKRHEAKLLFLDTSKARAEMGWRPKWDISETLSQTVSWYRAAHAQDDLKMLTERQIETYMSAMSSDSTKSSMRDVG